MKSYLILSVLLILTGCGTYDRLEDSYAHLVKGEHDGRYEQGETGIQGVDGEHGPQGAPGRDGQDGTPGLQGPAGVAGVDGRDGTDGTDGSGCSVREERRGPNTFVIVSCTDGTSAEWKK